MIFGDIIDQGIVRTTKESEVSTWHFPQEDKINLECLSFDEGGTLEPEYSPSPKLYSLYFGDITNEEENIQYIRYMSEYFPKLQIHQHHLLTAIK